MKHIRTEALSRTAANELQIQYRHQPFSQRTKTDTNTGNRLLFSLAIGAAALMAACGGEVPGAIESSSAALFASEASFVEIESPNASLEASAYEYCSVNWAELTTPDTVNEDALVMPIALEYQLKGDCTEIGFKVLDAKNEIIFETTVDNVTTEFTQANFEVPLSPQWSQGVFQMDISMVLVPTGGRPLLLEGATVVRRLDAISQVNLWDAGSWDRFAFVGIEVTNSIALSGKILCAQTCVNDNEYVIQAQTQTVDVEAGAFAYVYFEMESCEHTSVMGCRAVDKYTDRPVASNTAGILLDQGQYVPDQLRPDREALQDIANNLPHGLLAKLDRASQIDGPSSITGDLAGMGNHGDLTRVRVASDNTGKTVVGFTFADDPFGNGPQGIPASWGVAEDSFATPEAPGFNRLASGLGAGLPSAPGLADPMSKFAATTGTAYKNFLGELTGNQLGPNGSASSTDPSTAGGFLGGATSLTFKVAAAFGEGATRVAGAAGSLISEIYNTGKRLYLLSKANDGQSVTHPCGNTAECKRVNSVTKKYDPKKDGGLFSYCQRNFKERAAQRACTADKKAGKKFKDCENNKNCKVCTQTKDNDCDQKKQKPATNNNNNNNNEEDNGDDDDDNAMYSNKGESEEENGYTMVNTHNRFLYVLSGLKSGTSGTISYCDPDNPNCDDSGKTPRNIKETSKPVLPKTMMVRLGCGFSGVKMKTVNNQQCATINQEVMARTVMTLSCRQRCTAARCQSGCTKQKTAMSATARYNEAGPRVVNPNH